MTRAYDEFVAAVFDVVPAPLALFGLILLTALVAVLWYRFPAWLPRRLPRLRPRLPRLARLRLPRWRTPRIRLPRLDWRRLLFWRRTKKEKAALTAGPAVPAGGAPAPRAAAHLSLADRLAAEGRFAEAIRQRLRDTVAELTRAGVIAPQPGWTAAELTTAAAANRPGIGPALGGATEIFSEIWYAERPALAGHDERMRRLVAEVRSGLGASR